MIIAQFSFQPVGENGSRITQGEVNPRGHEAKADVIVSGHGQHAIDLRQLDHRDNGHDRRVLEHGDEIVGDWRDHHTNGLRQYDVLKGLPAAHAQRQCSFGLAARDGLDAGAIILRLTRGVIQAEADYPGYKRIQPDANLGQPVIDQKKLDQ